MFDNFYWQMFSTFIQRKGENDWKEVNNNYFLRILSLNEAYFVNNCAITIKINGIRNVFSGEITYRHTPTQTYMTKVDELPETIIMYLQVCFPSLENKFFLYFYYIFFSLISIQTFLLKRKSVIFKTEIKFFDNFFKESFSVKDKHKFVTHQ